MLFRYPCGQVPTLSLISCCLLLVGGCCSQTRCERDMLAADGSRAADADDACANANASVESATACDRLVGWYAMERRDAQWGASAGDFKRVIPVLKRGGEYFTTGRGFEFMLVPDGDALRIDMPPKYRGSTIERDAATGEFFMRVFDSSTEALGAAETGQYTPGERRKLERVPPPDWLRDPTTSPPRGLADFVGTFEFVYLPGWMWSVGREGNAYYMTGRGLTSWAAADADERVPLTPLEDGQGFTFESGRVQLQLRYDATLRRYELTRLGKAGKEPHALHSPMYHVPATHIGL